MPASRLLDGRPTLVGDGGTGGGRAIAESLGAADARAAWRPVDGDRIKRFMERVEELRARWR